MKKINKRKLSLKTENIRVLVNPELTRVAGGLSRLGTGCLSCECWTPDCPVTH